MASMRTRKETDVDYSNLRKFSRSAAAVRRIAASRGYHGTIHRESKKVGTYGEQLAAVGIYLDARKEEPRVPREWIWESARSAVIGNE